VALCGGLAFNKWKQQRALMAGSAGCLPANRRSADPSAWVRLLEGDGGTGVSGRGVCHCLAAGPFIYLALIHHREIRTRRLARCVLWRDFPKLTSPSEAPLSAFLAPVALQDRQTVLWLHLLFFVRGTIHIGHVHLLVTTCQEGWRIKLTSNRAVRLRGNAALPTAPRRGPPSPAGRSRRSERRMGLVP
jgi:hypothetical protein